MNVGTIMIAQAMVDPHAIHIVQSSPSGTITGNVVSR